MNRDNPTSCDIFCRVIDNFGDAGIAWRLALSLHRERNWSVRLIIDDMATLARIIPQVDASKKCQEARSVTVTLWDKEFDNEVPGAPADVVIEAFSCFLPEKYEAAINGAIESGRKVAVFALDYLTAESWAEESHLLNSPHPRYGYPKTFYFPGFSAKSGGVIYEKNLAKDLQDFVSHGGKRAMLEKLGADPEHPFTVFLFTYPTVPVADLAAQVCRDPRCVQFVLAPGEASETFAKAVEDLGAPEHVRIVRAPMVDQSEFDFVLASMDACIVRGEDSVVRCQLAGVPLIWTLYPQTERTHMVKLEAFANLYCRHLAGDDAAVWLAIENGLNDNTLEAGAWGAWRDRLEGMREGAENWQKHLFSHTSLTTRIADLAELRLQ